MSDWIESYITFLLESNNSEAANVKARNLPKLLYRYRPLNNYTLKCLQNSTVWMSSAKKLNDPYELVFAFDEKELTRNILSGQQFTEKFFSLFKQKLTEEEIDEIIAHEDIAIAFHLVCKRKGIKWNVSFPLEHRRKRLQEYRDALKHATRICSFSERNDSILMWSHYADNHKGICVAYDFLNTHAVTDYLEPIYYTENLLILSNYISRIFQDPSFIKVLAISKSKIWEYEKEWRIVFSSFHAEDGGEYDVPKPMSIYLGIDFEKNSQKDKDMLFEFADQNRIAIVNMMSDERAFKLY